MALTGPTFEDYVAGRLPSLLRLAGALAGDPGTAEEVVQEVLLRASRQWPRIADLDAPNAYVRRMVVNEYQSWRRKWARLVPRAVIETGEAAPDPAERHAARDEITRRLARLPPRQKAVIVLRFYEGMSDDAIAEVLGCSVSTVRSQASRALASLRLDAEPDRTVDLVGEGF